MAMFPCNIGSSGGTVEIGTMSSHNSGTYTVSTQPGQIFAIASYNSMGFTNGQVIATQRSLVSGYSVPYAARLTIVMATSNTLTMTPEQDSGLSTVYPYVVCSIN